MNGLTEGIGDMSVTTGEFDEIVNDKENYTISQSGLKSKCKVALCTSCTDEFTTEVELIEHLKETPTCRNGDKIGLVSFSFQLVSL